METVKTDDWYHQLTPENRRKVDGMANLLLEAQRKNYDSDEQFKRIIVRANGAEYIAFAAIICGGVGQCQRRCDFVIFRRTGNVRKWRIKVCSL